MTETSKLTWLPQKTFTLEFSLPWAKVKTAYETVMQQLVKNTDIKGFRTGKAPREIVEKQIDKGKVYGEVINRLLPISYSQAIKHHQLKPALPPKITIVSAEEGKAWSFSAKSCELPEVKLGDYQAIAKGALAKDKLWTPDKGKSEDKASPPTPSQKLNLVAQALLKEISLDLPELLIESERDRLLAKLIAELQQLNLTIEQFASSNQKTVNQVKQEYSQTAANTLRLELILQAVADDRKISVKEEEIDKMIDQAGDDKLKKQLNTPGERAYINAVLRKKQAIDFLVNLG